MKRVIKEKMMMNINYDIEKIKRIIDDLCIITGLSMSITDSKCNCLYMKTKQTDEICIRIQSQPGGNTKCVCSDTDLIKKCEEKKKTVSHICHAGLLDTVVPVIKNNVIVAFIMIGRVLPTKDTESLAKKHAFKGEKIEELKKCYNKMTYLSEEQLKSFVNLLSYILFENAIEIDFDSSMGVITDYIDNNLNEDLSVKSLCERFFVSKNYLYKAFRSYFNCTVNEYVTNQKLKKAMRLIEDTSDSFYTIAEESGIGNYTYFTKLFKKKTGFSPKDYRHLLKKDSTEHR